MDVNMPVVDGLEATQIIKKMVLDKKINDVYIIITTALDKGEDRIKFLKSGANSLLPKPVSLNSLIDALKDFSYYKSK